MGAGRAEVAEAAAAAWAKAVEKAHGNHPHIKEIEEAVAEVLISSTPHSVEKTPSEIPDHSMLQELLYRELRRFRKHIEADQFDQMLEVIEHIRILIERYRSDSLSVIEPEKRP